MSEIEVTFPKPCDADWKGMSEQGRHRFCSRCATPVHDLGSLTDEEVQSLLDRNENVCVRARVFPNGTVETRSNTAGISGRISASLGAALALSLAACQSVPAPSSPRYELKGEVTPGHWATVAVLIGPDGNAQTAQIRDGEPFRLKKLTPGTYTLVIYGECGEAQRFEDILITANDVDLGEIQWGLDCIVIGAMDGRKTYDLG